MTSVKSANSSAISQLFKSLHAMCTTASDGNSRFFSATDEQLDYLWFTQLRNLDQWYQDQFVAAMRAYEQSEVGTKSETEAVKYKELADLYGKNDKLIDKAFECINKAIRYSPSANLDFLCNCFVFRSELHRCINNDDELAVEDIRAALHFRPKSYTCLTVLLDRLTDLKRYSEAYQLVADWLKQNSAELSTTKWERLKQLKQTLHKKANMDQDSANSKTSTITNARHNIWVNSRVQMVRNEDNRRFYFRSTGFIASEEQLIVEKPSMFLLKHGGLTMCCSECLEPCANTFWPCAQCSEVIFCSKRCMTKAATFGHHRDECGIIGLMQNEISTKAAQAYRLLVQSGHQELLKMSASVKTFLPENYFPDVYFGSEGIDSNQVAQWFWAAQCDLRTQLHHRAPIRSASELAGAIFLYALYRYKTAHIKTLAINDEQLTQLIAILANEIAKVTLTQFGWHEDVNNERLSIGTFQCLVGSHLNHSCEENANWTYDNGNLVVKASADIQPGQSISISYGSSISNRSFYKRQGQVQTFGVACNCDRCARDVRKNFAFRCDNCNGPVPFEVNAATVNAVADMVCMRCERPFTYKPKTGELVSDFLSTQRLIWLVQAISDDEKTDENDQNEDYLQKISSRMDMLAGYVDPYNLQWLRMITDLCELFCERKWFDRVVGWVQWLSDRFDILLAADEHSQLDSLEQLHALDQWTTAYIAFMVEFAEAQLDETRAKHIATTEKLFKRIFVVLDAIAARTDIDHLVEDKRELVACLRRGTRDKWNQFAELSQTDMAIPVELDDLRLEDDLEFLSTATEEDKVEVEGADADVAEPVDYEKPPEQLCHKPNIDQVEQQEGLLEHDNGCEK